MDIGEVRQLVKVSDGRIGVVMGNEDCGGVFRGCCNMWFGQFTEDGKALVEMLLVGDDWDTIKCPMGKNEKELVDVKVSKMEHASTHIFDIKFTCSRSVSECDEVHHMKGNISDIVDNMYESGWPLCPECDDDMVCSAID